MLGTLIRVGQFFFRYRDALAPLVFLMLIVSTKPRLAFGSVRGDALIDGLGILVVAGAQVLRVGVIGYAYIIRGGKNKQVYAEQLVQEGFFAHSRNPLYLGNLVGICGLLVIHNSPSAYMIGIPFSLFLYVTIVVAEEDFLPQVRRRVRGIPRTGAAFHPEFCWTRQVLERHEVQLEARSE